MKKTIVNILGLLLLLTSTASAVTVTINGAQTYQTIDGFGVNANAGSWTNDDLVPVMDAFINQAGMTMFLVEFVGNCNWYTYNANPGSSLTNWAYFNSVYSGPNFQQLWGMMAYLNQRGFTNGVMPKFTGATALWMGGTSLNAASDNDYAKMMASALIYARKNQNLQFTIVPPFNEPDIDCCDTGVKLGGGAAQLVAVLDALGQLLDANGMGDVRFSGPELASINTGWMTTMMTDSYLMSKLADFGLHSYVGSTPSPSGVASFIQQSTYPNTRFWMTEFGVWCDICNNGNGDNSWANAQGIASALLTDLADGASAGLTFEAYDSAFNNYNSQTGQDAPASWGYWGLFAVTNINAAHKTYTARKQFYTLAQITKYVSPGAIRIGVSGSTSPLTLLAFYQPTTGQLTLTGVNTGASAVALSGSLTSLSSVHSLELYYTDSAVNLSDSGTVPVNNGAFAATVPANCVFTLASSAVVVVPPNVTSPTNQALARGANALFIVSATGTAPLAYQWRFAGVPVAGATNSAYSRTNIQCSDAGAYDVVVTNAGGSITSSAAILTVVSPPLLVASPTNKTVTVGQSASFSVTATNDCGGGLAYQWQLAGTNLVNATSAALLIASAQGSNAGSYTAVVSNLAGAVTSGVAVLTVGVAPVVSGQPTNLTVFTGGSAVFTTAVNGSAPLAFQWRMNGAAIANGGGISGATSNVLTLSGFTNNSAGNYGLSATNLFGVATSSVASLAVVFPLSIQWSFTNRVLAANSNCSAVLPDVTGTNYIQATDLSGPMTIVQSPTNGTALPLGTNQVVLTVTDALGNVAYSTNTVAVADQTPPVLLSQPLSQACNAGTNVSFGVVATACTPIGFQWLFNNTPLAAQTNNTLNRTNLQCSDAGAYEVVVTSAGGSATSSVAVLTVVSPPLLVGSPTNQTVIVGQSASFSVTATNDCGGGLAYQWQLAGTNVVNATSATLLIPNAQQSDAGAYTVIVSNLAGSVTSGVAVLNVGIAPIVSGQPTNLTVFTGGNAVFATTVGGSAPLAFQWWMKGVAIADGPGISGAASNVLTLTSVTSNSVGSYSLSVTNVFGVTTSSVASLTVVFPLSIPWSFTNLVLAANSNCSAVLTDVTGTNYIQAADLSGPVTIVQSPTNGTTLLLGTNEVVLMVTDAFGNAAYSTNTVVVEDQTPPVFLSQPLSQADNAGTNASFSVVAAACTPVGFQWFFDNTPLAAQTNSTLTLVNIDATLTGDYFVVAAASGGSSTSAVAVLTVLQPRIALPGSLSASVSPDHLIALTLTGSAGSTYILETTADLGVPGSWQPIATNTLDTNGLWYFSDLITNGPQRFYRSRLPQ